MSTNDKSKEMSDGIWPKLSSDLLYQRSRELHSLEARRVATLERQAPLVVDMAKRAGTDIEPLGVGPLFNDLRVYAGQDSDWVLGPAGDHEACIVPAEEQRRLDNLVKSGLLFRLVYVAHEVVKGSIVSADSEPGTMLAEIDRSQARSVIPAVPPPAGALGTGERLDEHSRRVFSALRLALPVIGAVAMSPLLLVGAALDSLGTLDPIVIGAIPALSTRVGEPAAFYVLARWQW